MDFNALFAAVEKNATGTLLVLTLLALGVLARHVLQLYDKHAAEKAALQELRLKERDEQHAAHLQTVTQVIPLARDLNAGIGTVERMVDKLIAQKDGSGA